MPDRNGHAVTQPTPAPNPAAAAFYTQAAADYETAARDADKLGAHDRATSHRRRAADYRTLAAAWSDDNAPVIPKIPRPRKPSISTTPSYGACPRCGGTRKSPDGGMCAACFGSGQLRNSATAVTA